jgi:hypothetical protein
MAARVALVAILAPALMLHLDFGSTDRLTVERLLRAT